MPRRSRTEPRTVTAGPYIVRNPTRAPKGHRIIVWHVCDPSMKHETDAAAHVGVCSEQRWFEGEVFEPPDGFPLDRFLRHRPAPGRTCDDDSHENCAGPFLAEGVSSDG